MISEGCEQLHYLVAEDVFAALQASSLVCHPNESELHQTNQLALPLLLLFLILLLFLAQLIQLS